MAIDAIIQRIEYNRDGTATMFLVARDSKAGPAGQTKMKVINPPPYFDAAVGTAIWGGADTIMVGEKLWAKRIGYTRCELV